MTEAEWFAAKDLWEMVFYISEQASYRKLKLYTSALHQEVAPGCPAPCYPEQPEPLWFIRRVPGKPPIYDPKPGGNILLKMIFHTWADIEGADERLEKFIPPLAHCVFGNPFRPVMLDSWCVTPTVRALAEAAYNDPEGTAAGLDGSTLAILADALEEAGCGDAGLLAHLRGPEPHARGCFAIDAILRFG